MTAELSIIESILAGGMIILVIIFLLYFLPSFIAKIRGHKKSGVLFLINLFLGWTIIIWIILLIWAIIGGKK